MEEDFEKLSEYDLPSGFDSRVSEEMNPDDCKNNYFHQIDRMS